MGGAVGVGVEDRCEKFAVGGDAGSDRFRVGEIGAASRLRRRSRFRRLSRCRVRRMRRCVRPVHDESHAVIISYRITKTTVRGTTLFSGV